MLIWTTQKLNDLLLERDLPVRLQPENTLKDMFLINAEPGDFVMLDLDEQYLEFLEAAKERGNACPIFLISPEPTIIEHDLRQYHALLFDLKRMGTSVIKDIIHHCLSAAVPQAGAAMQQITLPKEADAKIKADAVADPAAILDILRQVVKKNMPVIVAFEIREKGKPVTARGVCNIKEVQSGAVVLDRFRQSLMLKGLRKGVGVKILISHGQKNLEAVAGIQESGAKEVRIALPDRLFSTKEIRLQPNDAKPINLYILIPGEPTTRLDVLDISPRGLGFLCPRDLPVNKAYGFTLILPDPAAVIVLPGIIRFKKEAGNGIRYGAEIHPHPWDEESIAKYIMQRESEILGLLRNL